MNPLQLLLFRAAASPFGVLVRSTTGASARQVYQKIWQAKQADPSSFGNLQVKAAGASLPEGDFVIYKKEISTEELKNVSYQD